MTPLPDREARFRELYLSCYLDVVRFAARRVEEREAEDVAADAFLVVWRRLDELPRRASDARAWLFGIARGCLLNARRGRSRHDGLAVRLAALPPGAGAEAGRLDDGVARRVDLAAAWQVLSPGEQEVLALALLDGVTSAEAALVLGTTATAYRLRLMRARAVLRRLLDDPPAPAVPTAQPSRTSRPSAVEAAP